MNGKMTYFAALIISVYAIIARGFGANDWNTASILIAIALIGVCIRIELQSDKKV